MNVKKKNSERSVAGLLNNFLHLKFSLIFHQKNKQNKTEKNMEIAKVAGHALLEALL